MSTPAPVEPVVHQLVRCPHCQTDVPADAYCGNCGAHLATSDTSRHHAFAGAPHEHVLHSAIVSTLFPHLPRRQAHVFRLVLAAAVAAILILAAIRLVAPATLVSVLVLPVLYLLYLYESEVYEDEPLLVVALTFVVGGGLGYLYVVIADRLSTSTLTGTQQGPLVTGVLLPVIAQALMLAGPLVLLARAKFSEMLDGLSFGVASGLGFTMVAVIAASWHLFTIPLVNGIAVDDILRIVRSGILAAIVNAGTTGLITSAVWLHVHRPSDRTPGASWLSLPLVVAAGFIVQIGLGVAGYYMPSLLGLVVMWAIVAAVLLIMVRVVLHFGLLEEAAERVVGALSACPECHHLVAMMPFCPHCGGSRLAMPKHARHAHAGAV